MQSKKKNKTGSLALTAACILGGIVGGVYAVWLMPYLESQGVSVIFELVFLVLGFILQTLVHEFGHLVFGLLSGYRFSSFRIFNIMLLRRDGKFELKRLHIAGTAGQCLMDAPRQSANAGFILYNLGGCILNIAVSGIFAAVAVFSTELPYLFCFSVCAVLCGIIFALINGIPMKTENMPNDGYNTYLMLNDRTSVDAFFTQLQVNGYINCGMRVSEMPDELFSMPTSEQMKNPLHASVGVLCANRLLDEHRFDDARRLICDILESGGDIVGIHENLLRCDLIYICLLTGERSEAENLLTKELLSFMKAMKNFPSVLRVNYALALSGVGNMQSSEFYLSAFEKLAKSYPHPADIASERELIEAAEEKICN